MKEKQVKIIKNNVWEISKNKKVKVILQGKKFAEMVYVERKNKGGTIRKINKDFYSVVSTGEIKSFNKKDGKENKESIKKTFNNLRGLIRNNFGQDFLKELFITLTYAKNMQDKDKLYKDFSNFIKRLKRRFKEHKFEYIVVAEPQGRGAWHMHLMLKSDKKLYIKDNVIRELWGHGITQTERLKSDDVGTYYVAYFTDLEIENKEKNKKNKKYVKGARFNLYPKHFKFYRCSRGIKKCEKKQMLYRDLVKEFGEPIWKQAYDIFVDKKDKGQELINKIYKATFKKNKQEIKKKVKKIKLMFTEQNRMFLEDKMLMLPIEEKELSLFTEFG